MNYSKNIVMVKAVDTVVSCTENEVKPVSSKNIANGLTPGPSTNIIIEPTKLELEERYSQAELTDFKTFIGTLKKKRLQEKLVYVISISTIVLLTYSLMASRWLLPYYYTISTPFLLLIRTIMYWKYRWHYFLLDFCYYGNILWFAFIWLAPHHGDLFCLSFAIANGPLLWAMLIFRNSLVLHSIDKLTSVYIHILPAFLSYVLRWYPEETSSKWYRQFLPVFSQWSFLWLVGVPFACFILHSIYSSVVTIACQPPESYLTSFRYLTSKPSTLVFKAVDLFGPKWRLFLFTVFNWLFCFISVTMTILWYNYFIAHSIFLAFMFLVITFNGASFYLDVFSVRAESSSA